MSEREPSFTGYNTAEINNPTGTSDTSTRSGESGSAYVSFNAPSHQTPSVSTTVNVHDVSVAARGLELTSNGVRYLMQQIGVQSIRFEAEAGPEYETFQQEVESIARELRDSCGDIIDVDVSANDRNITPETRARYLAIAQQYLYALSLIPGINDESTKSELVDRLARIEPIVAPCWIKDLGRHVKTKQNLRADATIIIDGLETLQGFIDELGPDLTDTSSIEMIIEAYTEYEKMYRSLGYKVSSEKGDVLGDPFIPRIVYELDARMAEFDRVISQLRFEEARQDYEDIAQKNLRDRDRIEELRENITKNSSEPFQGPPTDEQRLCVIEWIELTRDLESRALANSRLRRTVIRNRLSDRLPDFDQSAAINALRKDTLKLRADILPWMTYDHDRKGAALEAQLKEAADQIKTLEQEVKEVIDAGHLYVGEAHRDVVAQYHDIDGYLKVIDAGIAQWKEDAPRGANTSLSTTPTIVKRPIQHNSPTHNAIIAWKKSLKHLKNINEMLNTPDPQDGHELVVAVEKQLQREVDADDGPEGIGPDRFRTFIEMIAELLDYIRIPEKPNPNEQKKYTLRERLDLVVFRYRNSNGSVRERRATEIIKSFRDLRRNQRDRDGNGSRRNKRQSGRMRKGR